MDGHERPSLDAWLAEAKLDALRARLDEDVVRRHLALAGELLVRTPSELGPAADLRQLPVVGSCQPAPLQTSGRSGIEAGQLERRRSAVRECG